MRTILLSAVAAFALTASAFAQGGGQSDGGQGSGAQQRPMINSPGGGNAPGMGSGEMQRAPDGGMQRQGAGADTQRQGDAAQGNRNQTGRDQAQGNRNQQPGQKAQGGQNDRAGAVGNTGDRTRINITNNNQRTVIRKNIVRGNVRLPAGVTIAIGTRLPATIAFQPVPAVIVAEIPELEPYYYVVVDGQVVFVDPATYEIVYVMPV